MDLGGAEDGEGAVVFSEGTYTERLQNEIQALRKQVAELQGNGA